MFPPVPLTLRQAIEDDVYADKYHIPAGTIVQLSIGPMMRSVLQSYYSTAFYRTNDEVNTAVTIVLLSIGPMMRSLLQSYYSTSFNRTNDEVNTAELL